MNPRIAVVSAGGIGGPLSAFLVRVGHDVTVIEQWSLHARAMKEQGLHVVVGPLESPEDEFTVLVRTLEISDVSTLDHAFDIVFLASKSYDSRWLTQLIEPYLDTDGLVVSLQNSLNNEWISPIVGESRVLASVLFAGGELIQPGHVWRTHPMYKAMYTVGEQDGTVTSSLVGVAKVLGDAGVTSISSNIRGLQWTKVILTTFSATLSALVDPHRRTWELVEDPLYRKVAGQLYREGFYVAKAHGVALEPLYGVPADELVSSFDAALQGVMEGNSEAHSQGATNMIQHDLKRGRPTEVEFLNGLIARKGFESGLATPANNAMVELFRQLERGDVTQAPDNLIRLAEKIWP